MGQLVNVGSELKTIQIQSDCRGLLWAIVCVRACHY